MTSIESGRMHRGLYQAIASWYADVFYDDLSDADWISEFVRATPPGTIVDLGSGPGQYARLLRSDDSRVVSLDIAYEMLRLGIELDSELLPVVADAHQLPLAKSSISGVLAAYTLEHVSADDLCDVLASLINAMTPGATLGLMVKCGAGAYGFHSTLAPGQRGFVQLWDLTDLAKILVFLGFEIVAQRTKAPISPHEFQHERGFILARLPK